MTHIRLERYTFRIPPHYNVSINGVNFQDVINNIADTQEQNTKLLEASIHTSYRTALWANGLSCFAALCGLIAQFFQWRHEKDKPDDDRQTDDHTPNKIAMPSDPHPSQSEEQHENATASVNESEIA